LRERDTKGEPNIGKAPKYVLGVFKRGFAPLPELFPLSLEGEGDTGGEGEINYQKPKGGWGHQIKT